MVNDGRWHQVVVTYDGEGEASGLNISIDGSPTLKTAMEDSMEGSFANQVPLVIGGRTSTDRFCIGAEICDVRIVGRTMTDREIRSDYLAMIQSLANRDQEQLNMMHLWMDYVVSCVHF